jgi:hypothetical protein
MSLGLDCVEERRLNRSLRKRVGSRRPFKLVDRGLDAHWRIVRNLILTILTNLSIRSYTMSRAGSYVVLAASDLVSGCVFNFQYLKSVAQYANLPMLENQTEPPRHDALQPRRMMPTPPLSRNPRSLLSFNTHTAVRTSEAPMRDHAAATTTQPSRRREVRRLRIACTRCRHRKIRCCAAMPSCTACMRNGL